MAICAAVYEQYGTAAKVGPGRLGAPLEPLEGTDLGHDDPLVALEAGPRSLAAESRDRRQHQARVPLSQRLVAEPHPIEHPRPERLHQHIGVPGQPRYQVQTTRGSQIGLDAVLSPPEVWPARIVAQRAAARRLHEHHLGSVIGKEVRDPGPRRGAGDIDEPYAGEEVARRGIQTLCSSWGLRPSPGCLVPCQPCDPLPIF